MEVKEISDGVREPVNLADYASHSPVAYVHQIFPMTAVPWFVSLFHEVLEPIVFDLELWAVSAGVCLSSNLCRGDPEELRGLAVGV